MSWISTAAIAAGLRAKIQSLGTFEVVEPFLHRDLFQALLALRANSARRCCFIVPQGDDFQNDRSGRELRSKRTSQFALLIADRHLRGDKQGAAWGSDGAVGVIALKDSVLGVVTGEDLGIDNCLVMPGAGEPFTLEEDAPESAGRECWAQTVEVDAWWIRTSVPRPRGPTELT